jgi:hypothetical protein
VVQLRSDQQMPAADRVAAYQGYHAAYSELYASTSRVMHRLSELSR